MTQKLWLPLLAAFTLLSFHAVVEAQEPVHVKYEQSIKGWRDFLDDTSAGTVGLLKDCTNRPQTFRGRAFLVEKNQLYWGIQRRCVTLVVNHKKRNQNNESASYIGVRVIKFYLDEVDPVIKLERNGVFLDDDGKELSGKESEEFNQEQMSQEQFNQWHRSNGEDEEKRARREFEKASAGFLWHGTPRDGKENSWKKRHKFVGRSQYDSRLTTLRKTLDNKIVRFVPYDQMKRPDGAVDISIRADGAVAMAVSVFSPLNNDYSTEFAIILTDRQEIAQKVSQTLVVRRSWFRF